MPSGMRAQDLDSRAEAPWWIVEPADKKKARLNRIRHLLTEIPFREMPRAPIVLPPGTHLPGPSPASDPQGQICG